jgi:hypothetical protein
LHTNITALVKVRDDAAAEIVSLDSAIGRLDRVSKSTSGAIAELAAIHQDHQTRVESWSMNGGEGAIPSLDRKHVARLERERDDHEDSKASAEAGLKTLVEKRSKVQIEHLQADRAVTIAALLVIVNEDLPRVANELKLARQAQTDRASEFENLRSSILAQGVVLAAPELAHVIDRLNIQFEQPVANGSLDAINAKLTPCAPASSRTQHNVTTHRKRDGRSRDCEGARIAVD